MKHELRRIFLVEDNPGDLRLIQEALNLQEIRYELTHVETADEAIRTLNRYSTPADNVPDLILLDFNIPRGDARDILMAAAKNPALVGIPKAVVTSSVAPRDRQQALDLGAQCFIYKPPDLDAFLTEVGSTIAHLLSQDQARGMACDAQ